MPSEQKPPPAAKAKKQANIQLGVDLIALRNISTSSNDFSRLVRTRYEINPPHASACMRVARLYADKDKIIARLNWPALVALASPSVLQSVRKAFEVRIMAGERITAAEIRRSRRRRVRALKSK